MKIDARLAPRSSLAIRTDAVSRPKSIVMAKAKAIALFRTANAPSSFGARAHVTSGTAIKETSLPAPRAKP